MEKSTADWTTLDSFVDSSVEVGHLTRVELAERLQIPVSNKQSTIQLQLKLRKFLRSEHSIHEFLKLLPRPDLKRLHKKVCSNSSMGSNWVKYQKSIAKAFFVNHPRNPLTSLRSFLEQDCPKEIPNKYFDESFENEESYGNEEYEGNEENFEMEEDYENEEYFQYDDDFFRNNPNEEFYENEETFEDSEVQGINYNQQESAEIKQELMDNGDIPQKTENNTSNDFSQSQTVLLGKGCSIYITISTVTSVRPSVVCRVSSVRHKKFFSLKSPWNHPLTPWVDPRG